VKQRAAAGLDGTAYRARSAFKLVEIDKKYRVLAPGQVVCDLGAAPGGSYIAFRSLLCSDALWQDGAR
jgi:23S rRNA U2552 (ribose-2'-O)-methylase RlmE/FtsJ